MLKLADLSQHADKSSLSVTQEAYNAALKLLLSHGHTVQYEQVAQVNFATPVIALMLQSSLTLPYIDYACIDPCDGPVYKYVCAVPEA